MILFLQRHEAEGDAVYGDMHIYSSDGTLLDEMTTLENRTYMIATNEEEGERHQPSGTQSDPQGPTPTLPTREGEGGGPTPTLPTREGEEGGPTPTLPAREGEEGGPTPTLPTREGEGRGPTPTLPTEGGRREGDPPLPSLRREGEEGGPTPTLPTREGEERMFRVVMTWSPRFKRVLPLVSGVAGRSGIRFHQGSRPEHSHGCILLSAGNLNRLLLLLQETREEAWMVVKGSRGTHGTHGTHPCPPYEGREKGGGATPALPTEGGGRGSRGRRLAGMVVGIVLTGIVLAGCRGVQPGVRIEKSMRSAIDSSQQRRYERIESRDTVVVAVGGITGGAGGPGRPSSPRSQGGQAGGMEVVYRSHYEIRTERDTVCRSHTDTVYIERVDTVYPSRMERTVQSRVAQKKERRVPPFYRWCAGIVIGIILLGAVWIGVRVRRR